MLKIVDDFVGGDDLAFMRAVFEKAMCRKVETDGYTLMDLGFEVYSTQVALSVLARRVEALELPLVAKEEYKAKKGAKPPK